MEWQLKKTYAKIVGKIRRGGKVEEDMENNAKKTIITVVGKDTVGIIAKVCTFYVNFLYLR